MSLIVAVDEGGVIGKAGGLPWRLPIDLRHFKRITMGKPIVMGRKTWDSIGRPLPGRRSIVLTRNPDFAAEGCAVAHTPDEALQLARPADEIMVVGGAIVYRDFLERANRIYLTRVHAHFEGDVQFPALDPEVWREIQAREQPADEQNAHAVTFSILGRV